ncbi:nucleotide exchange factor GrpE [Trichothermofontia sichuanensis B231]|uniref:nucleotide exchange factor GrpE n=1 Tax=Trichothermofontia sichuanensis TaxID=3045816 RepID=UPI0022485252|nr:nucleotide exchange factor GrpE [Trichothermofontia sichuanensis B231]
MAEEIKQPTESTEDQVSSPETDQSDGAVAASPEPGPTEVNGTASASPTEVDLDQLAADILAEEAAKAASSFPVATDTPPPPSEATTSTAPSPELVALVEALKQEIETLKSQLEDRTSQYMRLAADFENFRKRTSKEKEELDYQTKLAVLAEVLPVVDSFERARAQIKAKTEAEMSIHKDYQGVYKQLVDCLKRLGVAPMRAEGKEFDPNWHEAVLQAPSAEHKEGTVIEELVRGYLLGDRVLRHAMVKVATAPEPEAETASAAVTEDAANN